MALLFAEPHESARLQEAKRPLEAPISPQLLTLELQEGCAERNISPTRYEEMILNVHRRPISGSAVDGSRVFSTGLLSNPAFRWNGLGGRNLAGNANARWWGTVRERERNTFRWQMYLSLSLSSVSRHLPACYLSCNDARTDATTCTTREHQHVSFACCPAAAPSPFRRILRASPGAPGDPLGPRQ